MTVGNPATNLIRFSTPLLIGNLAQQLYSTVDSIVVGNYVGDSALAAIGASGPIINLLLVLFMGVSVGASIMASQCFGAKDKKRLSHSAGTAITTTFTGQNIGAGRLDRVEKGTKDGLKLGLSVSVVLVALILFFGRYLMEMFTSTPDVIDTGMHMMRILSIGYIAMAVTQILSGVMRGAGDTMTPMWISLITTIVIRVPIAYGLAALMHSADALFISLLISWVMGAVLTSIAFRMGRWKKKSIINDDVPEPADV